MYEHRPLIPILISFNSDGSDYFEYQAPEAPAVGDIITITLEKTPLSDEYLGDCRVLRRTWDIRVSEDQTRLACLWIYIEKIFAS